jgi:superfamily II DNA or RNA helicase
VKQIILRPYQRKAITAVNQALTTGRSTLLVLPTSTGKTVIFSQLIKQYQQLDEKARQIVVAHREELINQAAGKIEQITEEMPDIEKGDRWADQITWNAWKARCIVTSVQTQNSGRGEKKRMHRFSPSEFNLAVCDEAHHATSKQWRNVITHYMNNPLLKLIGVTATPNRHDEAALGQVFGSCAYTYGMDEARDDGWIVPVYPRSAIIHSLDLSRCGTTAGDLNQGDLEREMLYEKPLLEIAGVVVEVAQERKTLIFTASVAHAERLCEILNRPAYRPGSARFVSGKTPDDERRKIFRDFHYGVFNYLLNCNVTTEGYDEPGIEVIVMARPTKSTPLYIQMLGRGTRTLPGIVDCANADIEGQLLLTPEGEKTSAELRRKLIAESAKPRCEVIDLVGNHGRHKIISAIDALGGKYSDEVLAMAKKEAEQKQDCRSSEDRLKEAAEKLIVQKEAEARKRMHIAGKVRYSLVDIDPFDILGVSPYRRFGWDKGERASEKQRAALQRWGIPVPDELTKATASALIGQWIKRKEKNLATLKQVAVLGKRGIDAANLKFHTASALIDALQKNGWRRLPQGRVVEIVNETTREPEK